MRRAYFLITLTLLMLAPSIALAGPQVANASTTTSLSMTFNEPDGTTPMADTDMDVFYIPPGDSASPVSDPLMGSGITNSSGAVTVVLNTSVVSSDLADQGDGQDNAFNAVAVAIDSSGNMATEYEVLALGGSVSGSATAITGGQVTQPQADAQPSMTETSTDTKYAYVPVLAENSGAGEETVLKYTYNSSVARQTKVTAAVSADGVSPWSAEGTQEESSDRSASTNWDVVGSYHYYIWADYEFKKKAVEVCILHFCNREYTWTVDHWAGSLAKNNPDPPCNGCSGSIGAVAYNTPQMPSDKNYYRTLSTNSSYYTRSSGQYQTYGFDLDFAGFVDVNSESTYGDITEVTYKLNSPNSCSQQEILWGKAADVEATDIVQANCGSVP